MSADRIPRPAPQAVACFNCTAWRPWDSIAVGRETAAGFIVIGRQPTGQCRATPPSIDPDAIGGETAAWPLVRASDWCRQFDPRDQNEEAA